MGGTETETETDSETETETVTETVTETERGGQRQIRLANAQKMFRRETLGVAETYKIALLHSKETCKRALLRRRCCAGKRSA